MSDAITELDKILAESRNGIKGDAKEIVLRLCEVTGDNRRLCLDAGMMIKQLYDENKELQREIDALEEEACDAENRARDRP